jgi:hypothetical protein
MGYRYHGSPVVCGDGTEPPPQRVTEYLQSTFPGARAPHAWLRDRRSTLDGFGKSFVMLRLGHGAPDPAPFEQAARRRAVPLETVSIDEPDARAVYERELVLVRPDGHVAWRGDALPADAAAIVAKVSGTI